MGARTVFVLWHGGHSYSPPEMSDLERFDSISDAKSEFETRHVSGRFNRFAYVHKPATRDNTPAVDETSEMHVFYADPTNSDDPYPDARIYIGPRGGVRSEPC